MRALALQTGDFILTGGDFRFIFYGVRPAAGRGKRIFARVGGEAAGTAEGPEVYARGDRSEGTVVKYLE